MSLLKPDNPKVGTYGNGMPDYSKLFTTYLSWYERDEEDDEFFSNNQLFVRHPYRRI